MTAVIAPSREEQAKLVSDAIAARPDGVLESVAESCDVSMQTVLEALPKEQAAFAAGEAFEDVWSKLTAFGPIVFIVHSADGVFETKGELPPGSAGRGYFNVHGQSPISGHIRSDRCKQIAFVNRLFFGRRSLSVQFLNLDGNVMFKVFMGRDESRELLADQVKKFEELRRHFIG
ncbi:MULTISPECIES: heme utilization cystosolic carrier protein HutX [unclassified Beijerinckia]|uniref:heme utilization cystosolic carrier protein HutX n=1 Tax=unclassified Beijerinckia TaxID=2638183 RepID=UPI00089B0B63|nr:MULTISPECIES: heme utilization cystosolic carrier protein HutX [unclassified Beijerinckia]MDH7795043.1 putative heme utilization carrier protein HutX [Beijerinckia sp. GAS462]SEB85261.1 heme utilization protein HuvX [Beijerinckia sp. 28-YEA-48]